MFRFNRWATVMPLGIAIFVASCNTPSAPIVSGTQPTAVVEAVITAAQTKRFDGLSQLCDPQKQNDEDTQQICNLETNPKMREKFTRFFGKMTIQGDAEVSEDGTQAAVEVLMGPDGDKAETINLVKRDGKWYLSSF